MLLAEFMVGLWVHYCGISEDKKAGKNVVEAWFMQLERIGLLLGSRRGCLCVCVCACEFVFNQEFDYILHVSRRVEFEELICLDKGVPRHDSFVNCYRDQRH